MHSATKRWACRFGASRWFVSTGFLLLGFCLAADAQPRSVEANFVVQGWQTDSGLPHNAVTSIEQTQDGYLWLGTSNGLARFDGVCFTTYRSIDHPGLRDNSILCLYEDRAGTLWIGTERGGLSAYSERKFESVAVSEGASSESILCIGEGASGELWVGTPSGLNRSDSAKAFFQSEPISGGPVASIRQPQRSPVMFAARKGIHQLRNGRVEPYEPGPGELRTNAFLCLHQDFGHRLWAGGPIGLVRVENSGETSVLRSSQIGNASVVSILEAADGQIWFATSAGGLFQVSSLTGPLEAALVSQFTSPATSLLQDNEGNLWVGTAGSGLYRVKRRQLRWIPFPGELSETAISCVFETQDGGVLLLAANNDLYQLQDRSFSLTSHLPLPEGVVVETACCPQPGEFWVGTRSDGLFRISGKSVRKFGERDGVSDSWITSFCPSASGLWIGTRNGGLNFLSNGLVTRFNTPWGYQGAYAVVLEQGPEGDLWIGTTGDGLFRLSRGRFSAWSKADGLSSGSICALCAEEDGTVWIGTLGGLCRFKNDRIFQFPGPNRIGAEAFMQLRSDVDGNLWAGSSSGIYRYRKDQLHAYADGKTRFLDVVPYGRDDGLPPVQCVPHILCQDGRAAPARPLFAAARGLVASQEPVLRLNTDPPPVILEGVFFGGEPVQISPKMKVPPGTASIQFQFTAPSLTAPGKVAFRYFLEGLDSDWSEAAGVRFARYPKVAPGKYTFRVVARNNDGVWNETGASVALVVAPFWWETHWFRIGLVALLGSAVVGFYRMRRAREREIARLRGKIASDLHDDVGSSLWSITLLSRILAQQGKLAPEERRDLAEINRIAVQTSNSIRDIIWLINPAFDSMQELLLRIKDSAAITLRGIDCRFHSEGLDLAAKIPSNVRQNSLFLVKEALTNIAKHANATVVELEVCEVSRHWRFVISDNGVGFDPNSSSSGNGVRNMRSRAEMVSGSLEIFSSQGHGTKLVVTIPKPRPRNLLRLAAWLRDRKSPTS